MPFRNLPAEVSTSDGRNFTLLKPLIFTLNVETTYRAPIGATTDGLSIPGVLWTAGLTPFGPEWLAGVIHDAAYRDSLERLAIGNWRDPDAIWQKETLNKADCDYLFREALHSLAIDVVRVEILYQGVRVGGQAAFDGNRVKH